MTRKTVYNNLVTQEDWDNVNEENKELLEDFLEYKRNTSKSKETLKQYEAMLKIFFVWVLKKAKNKHFTEINKREYIKFQGFCINDCGHSPNRIRTIRSAISSLSNYITDILDDEYPDFKNIILKIEPPVKTQVREKTVLSFKQCEEIAEKLMEKGKYQLACFMMVACYSGLRKSELTRLLIKDFTTDINMVMGGNFYQTTPIKVKGRGNRIEQKYVWNKVDKYLKAWIDYRNDNNIECEYLFCRKVGEKYKQILSTTADSFAKTLEKQFDTPIYMHCFRHLLTSELVRAGLPLDVPKILLGHKNVSVTSIYNDVSEVDSMEQFNDYFSGKIDKVNKKGLGDL